MSVDSYNWKNSHATQSSRIPYAAHALARVRQRAIDAQAVARVVDFGRAEHEPGGSSLVFLERGGERPIRREFGEDVLVRLGKRMRAYVVSNAEGAVVTVGHRTRRVKQYS
jgi:hypothetical protein